MLYDNYGIICSNLMSRISHIGILTVVASAMMSGVALADRMIALPSLPVAWLPNSEVTTNIALNVNWERLETLSFSIGVYACASNFVSVAVGTASDDALTLEEVDIEWGCDCGVWFSANTETGEVGREPVPTSGWTERELSIGKRQFNTSWNMVRLTKRGTGSFETAVSQNEKSKSFSLIVR